MRRNCRIPMWGGFKRKISIFMAALTLCEDRDIPRDDLILPVCLLF